MSLANLRAVVAVAETGSFTEAARKLGRSHATVSRAVASVERDLGGVRLFDRDGAGTEVTADGEKFARDIDAALEAIEVAVSKLGR